MMTCWVPPYPRLLRKTREARAGIYPINHPPTMVRIVAPHFVAGLAVVDGHVRGTAPILSYMEDWACRDVEAYCQQKHWHVDYYCHEALSPKEDRGAGGQP